VAYAMINILKKDKMPLFLWSYLKKIYRISFTLLKKVFTQLRYIIFGKLYGIDIKFDKFDNCSAHAELAGLKGSL
jgi:hypothetical protein